MEDNEVFKWVLFAIGGLVIYIFVMYQIVFNASYGRKIWRENVKQRNLLVEIAKSSGVPDNVIDEILDDVEPVTPVE